MGAVQGSGRIKALMLHRFALARAHKASPLSNGMLGKTSDAKKHRG